MYAQGVHPDIYPLLGRFRLRDPHGATLADTIRADGTIAITRDTADDLGLGVGDPVMVTDGGGTPQRLIIGGVIEMSPSHQGKSAYYSLETARQIANHRQAINGADLVVQGDVQSIADELNAAGWSVFAANDFSDGEKRVRIVFNFGLKGAGILALLVAGIGVANTMQVVLARRTTEVAVLKTLGYHCWHLMVMFGLETALIGTVGSLIGIGIALLVAHPLMSQMEHTGIFLLEWHAEPRTVISGGFAGIATSLIFGFCAVLRASAVRPAAILRQIDTPQHWLATVGAYGVLVVPFGVVSIFIMGTIVQGVGIILLALAGFLSLGLVMFLALWLVTRLPLPGLLKLARNNLKRQQLSFVFALIALFIGVVAISIAVATMAAAQQEVDERIGSLEGTNLVVYGQADQDTKLQSHLMGLDGVKTMQRRYLAEIVTLEIQVDGLWQPLEINWMEGRDYAEPAWGLDLSAAAWGENLNAAYLPEELQDAYGGLQAGMPLRLQGVSATAREMTLAGFFKQDTNQAMTIMQRSIIVDQSVVNTLGGGSSTVIYEAEIDVAKLKAATDSLGSALPSAMVISAIDVREVVQGILFSLFSFVITVAGFALVAGAVLIANAVGLSMIERHREIGIMKTVGYTSRHVLLTLALEYGQLGVIAGLLGTLAVKVAFRIVHKAEPDVVLSLDVVPSLIVIIVCIGFALASALSAAWHPTRIPPLAVLRDD